MAIPREQDYWEKRKKLGRPKNIPSPKKLWQLACDYFKDVDTHPWIIRDFRGSKATEVAIRKQRPYTWVGFEAYLEEKGIISHLEDYRFNKNGQYGEFSGVIARIDKIIKTQKFDGATVGDFNHTIIMRDLGIENDQENKERPIFNIHVSTHDSDK